MYSARPHIGKYRDYRTNESRLQILSESLFRPQL